MRIRAILGTAVALVTSTALAAPAGALPIPVHATHGLSRADTAKVRAQLPTGRLRTRRGLSKPCSSVKLMCRSIVVTTGTHSSTPLSSEYGQIGYSARDLTSAYGLTKAAKGSGTIALIETGTYPTLDSDLSIYRHFNGLPECTADSGCLRVVNRTGGSKLEKTPSDDELRFGEEEVAVETALDVDMASAACPACKILVVTLPIKDAFYPDTVAQGNAQYRDFATGVQTAVRLKAKTVSLSYGLPITEYAETGARAAAFKQSGVAIYASSGDSGVSDGTGNGDPYAYLPPGIWPQNLQTVISAGGTSLYQSADKTWSQAAWQGAGSFCAYDLKPAVGQPKSVSNACYGSRAASDISAVADPFTGVSVYDSYAPASGFPYGFLMVGGTSASAPFLAGVNARAGVAKGTIGPNAVYHAKAGTLVDITVGGNAPPGLCPSGHIQLCNSGKGWDGPTGMGTPKGLGAFAHTS